MILNKNSHGSVPDLKLSSIFFSFFQGVSLPGIYQTRDQKKVGMCLF